MRLRARRAALRPIIPSDHALLFGLALTGEIPWQWPSGNPNFEQFVASISDPTRIHYAIVDSENATPPGVPIGYVGMYGLNLVSRNAFIQMGLAPEYRRSAWPLQAAFLMIDIAFNRFPLKKLYAETTPDNFRQFQQGVHLGLFTHEATLSDHSFRNGELVDSIILSLYRADWLALRPRLESQMIPSGD